MKMRNDRKFERQKQAIERNKLWQDLSYQEQLDILNEPKFPFTATKQKAKIAVKLELEKAKNKKSK